MPNIENKAEEKIIIESQSDLTDGLVVYEKSNDIRINGSDLIRELSKFKRAIENSLSLPIFLAVISVWIPILTTKNFSELFGYTGESIKFGYIVLAFIISLLVLKPFLYTIIRFFLSLPYIKKFFKNWLYNNEIDPEKKTDYLLEKCNKENINGVT